MDIREWAKDNGIEVSAKGPIKASIEDKYWAAQGSSESFPGEPSDSGEVEGSERRPDALPDDKRGFAWGRTRRERAKPTARRRSIEGIVSTAWEFGAMLVASKQQLTPVARVLDMQSAVAGVVVNDIAKGTVIDKFLQPFARAGEGGSKAMAIVGPPMITTAILAKPELYPVLRPVLKMALASWIEVAEPAMEKMKKRQEKFAEKFGQADLDAMIDSIFAPLPDMQTTPDEGGDNASG